ncbi:MAG TPA: hypothetical protein VGR57_13845 [Ktedonobacterales bacterium]|nr:hypothetical protein [Ktedonobacterales bacterium]
MRATVILPVLSSTLSFLFAALVLRQWRLRRHPFQLVWGVGLVWYGIAAGTEVLGGLAGWNDHLYRAWYLCGAFYTAAWLGLGTIYLLAKTRFGYFAAFAIFTGGLFAWVFQLAQIKAHQPASWAVVWLVIGVATAGALAVAVATALRRRWAPHIAAALLVAASAVAAVQVMTARIAALGYRLDATTHAPLGSLMPPYLRVQTGPFNIAGAFCLVFGAVYSFYVYMPKRKVLRARVRIPVLAQLYGALAVVVNLVASLPLAVMALARGKLHSRVPATLLIALGGFVPSFTSGLTRYGITWAFFLGEFLGVALIFSGFLVSEEVFAHLRVRIGRAVLFAREATDVAEPGVLTP